MEIEKRSEFQREFQREFQQEFQREYDPPEPSPRGPPEPEQQPPQQQMLAPQSASRMNDVLFENLPRGVSEDDSSSILSLPNVPSPMSRLSPLVMVPNHNNSNGNDNGNSREYPNSSSRTRRPASAPTIRGDGQRIDDEEDTFYDDRSLEYRIQRTLGHEPQPLHNINTPSSVPVTPGGPMSTTAATNSTTHWNLPAFHFQTSSSADTNYQDELTTTNNNMRSHQSAMTIMKLKQDLRNAVNNLYLFKQEKEAAESKARQLKQQNEQLLQEHNSVNERAKSIEEERVQMDTTKSEYKACKEQLEQLRKEKEQMGWDMQQLKLAKECVEGENKELASRIQTVFREHQEDLKSFGENTDVRVNRLKGEVEAANKEIESLKESLSKAKSEGAEASNQLEKEKKEALNELLVMTEKHDIVKEEIEQLKKDLEAAKSASEEHTQQELDGLKQEYKIKQGGDKQEIICLQKGLQEANRPKKKQAPADMEDTQSALEKARESLAKRERELNQVKAENETQLQEIERLVAELGKLKQNTPPTLPKRETPKHLACQADISSEAPNHHATKGNSDSIQDRLCRIRDASERISFVKEHHNAIARLKGQHESQIKDLSSLHETTLQERIEEEASKLEAEYNDALEKVQSGRDTKIALLERRHSLEVERLKEELQRSKKISDESLQIAMSKATSFKQCFEQESIKREQLQQEVTALEEKLTSEKQRLADEHSAEVQSLNRKWSEEKIILLNVIQRDCNLVFENNRNKNQGSPKSVVYDFESNKCFGFSEQQESPTNVHKEPTAVIVCSGTSLPYSNLDDELRETEALVQSLLGGSKLEETC